MVAAVKWGGRDDPPDQAGRSNLMARLLTKGTRSRSAFQIAEALEAVGGGLDAFCGHDSLGMQTQTVDDDQRLQEPFESGCPPLPERLAAASCLRKDEP